MHLTKCDVHAGQIVKAGDLIGRSGGAVGDQPNAGSSTGPHLHFEIRINGTQHVDSLLFLSDWTSHQFLQPSVSKTSS